SGVSGITITSFEQVIEANKPTNKFRFYYSVTGDPFPGATETAPMTMTIRVAAGAWKDSANNDSAAIAQTINVSKPAKQFFIELQGGLTLDAAGLTDEPL